MGAVCTREGGPRGGFESAYCSRLVHGLCTRPEQGRGWGPGREDTPAASASSLPVPGPEITRVLGSGTADALRAPGGARAASVVTPRVDSRKTSRGSDVPFGQGDEVVVRRELGGGYSLKQGQTGKVIHIDGDGDALIDFPNEEEQWVHSSMFPKLEKVAGDPLVTVQICHLLPSACLSVCGWNILLGLVEAMYWHFIDPHRVGLPYVPVVALGVCMASFLGLDLCGLQGMLTRHANILAGLPPLLFLLSAIPDVTVRSSCLVAAAAAQGWSVVAALGCDPGCRRRLLDGWGVLVALLAMPMLRWFLASANPFTSSAACKMALGCAGIASATVSACDGGVPGRRPDAEEEECELTCRPRCDCGGWPAAISAGLMGGSALGLFQAYLTTLEQPATSAYSDPGPLLALWTAGALAVGIFTLAAVWGMTPWWLDTCQAALVIGLVPLIAGGLQCTGDIEVELWGTVRGSGAASHSGLLLLAAIFPFMLALLGKEVCLLAQARAAGRGLFMLGLVTILSNLAYYAMLFGGSAPVWGAQLQGQSWLHPLGLAVAWCLGVWGAPNGAARPSVHDLWYLSRHSGPPKREYMQGALALLAWVSLVFLLGAVPMRMARAGVQGPSDENILIVAGFNVQQGFDLDGWSNVNCVSDLLSDTNVDLAGLSESNAAHPISGNNDPALAYASRLKMHYIRGAPGALPSLDGAILSRLPVDAHSSVAIEPLMTCSQCPTPTHLWVRARVLWHGTPVEFHSVHFDSLADPAPQIRYVAQELRTRFREGPMILVGDFGLPAGNKVRPRDTALAAMVAGTGLTEAFGSLDENVDLPLPPTDFVSGQHHSYIFYRGLLPVGKWVHSRIQCSDHMLAVASFRRSDGG